MADLDTLNNALGAAYVSTMPLQQAYASAMDTDLAPKVTPPDTSEPFESDGFTALSTPGFDASINSNNQGFKNEDFNYAFPALLWQNTRTADGSTEYIQDPESGLIIWGNTMETPKVNYLTQLYQAKDGADFTLSRDDDTFNPHIGTTLCADLPTHQVITHYRIACSIGSATTILTAPTPATSVKTAKPRRSDTDNPLDPDLTTAPGPNARNLYYQLQTGIFAGQ